MSDHDSKRDVACTLSTDGRESRSENVRSVLSAAYRGATERADGYTLLFDGSEDALSAIATFVANERECCSFAEYAIEVSPPYERTRLTIIGPAGTKEVFNDLLEKLESEPS